MKIACEETYLPAFIRFCDIVMSLCQHLNYFHLQLDENVYLRRLAHLCPYRRRWNYYKTGNYRVLLRLGIDGAVGAGKEQLVQNLNTALGTERKGALCGNGLAYKEKRKGCDATEYKDCCFLKLPKHERKVRS